MSLQETKNANAVMAALTALRKSGLCSDMIGGDMGCKIKQLVAGSYSVAVSRQVLDFLLDQVDYCVERADLDSVKARLGVLRIDLINCVLPEVAGFTHQPLPPYVNHCVAHHNLLTRPMDLNEWANDLFVEDEYVDLDTSMVISGYSDESREALYLYALAWAWGEIPKSGMDKDLEKLVGTLETALAVVAVHP